VVLNKLLGSELNEILRKMCYRNSLNAQITQERSRAEAERTSHSAVQQQLSELEKEKVLIDLELKDAVARHKTELSRRDATISNVCVNFCNLQYLFLLLHCLFVCTYFYYY